MPTEGLSEETLAFDLPKYGADLKRALDTAGLSYREAERVIGVDHNTLQRVASGTRPPNVEHYLRIERWLAARAEGPAPGTTTYSEPEVEDDDGVVTVRAFSTDKLRVVSFAIHPDHVLKVTTPGSAERLERPAPPGGGGEEARPPRPDLAIGAITVAMKTTTDAEVQPWLQTALDFLTGDYEPLDGDDTKGADRG